jgi:hypothetical protein
MALGSQAIAPARIITQQGLYSIVQTLAKYIHLLKSRCCFTIDIKPSREIKALQLEAAGTNVGIFGPTIKSRPTENTQSKLLLRMRGFNASGLFIFLISTT